ncbi:uncharacterized protein LOC129585763 [Paramacrobiotus metropolitanus]|uniref:uncharacterized protein LOC129585763 n=1 Tax=Paramacrobiotus metropolitanus TaxID=2943436 RepID=UPI0024459B00|nr:uncharacterized protein LOC129585763 [Paramacrobiotus metropolitanus]XP_055334572.1 uncharacterized protein LOC129585763 [Paramacrobiotus metropolitanus]
MARQLPEASEPQKSPNHNGVGMYGSYYKVYRCSDGKYRLNLISEDEYVESKKNRPISVCDVSSTTDVACSHRPSSLFTSSPCCSSLSRSNATTTAMAAHGPLNRSTSSATTRSRLPSISQRISSAKTTTHDVNVVPPRQRAAVPARYARKHPYKHNTTAASVTTAGTDHDHPAAIRRQRRDRCVRSTVAVADLIAEYIPPDVPAVQDAVASSTSAIKPAALQQPALNSTPLVWNNWIKSVARRFPMADMSVRQVLDVLDSRPDLTATDD